MKRIMVCMAFCLAALTGCQSVEEMQNTSYEEHSYIVKNTVQKEVSSDTTAWDAIVNPLKETLSEDNRGYYICELNQKSYNKNAGVYEINGVINFGILNTEDIVDEYEHENKLTDDRLNVIEQVIGPNFKAFIEEAKSLQMDQSIGKVIGEYGVYAYRDHAGLIRLYVVQSGLHFNDPVMEERVKALCGEGLIVSAISQGEDKQIIELSTPGQLVYRAYNGMIPESTYYKVIMDKTGRVEKIQAMTRYLRNNVPDLSKEEQEQFKSLIETAVGQKLDTSKLEEAVRANMKDSKSREGSLDSWRYKVKRQDTYLNYEAMTVVDLYLA